MAQFQKRPVGKAVQAANSAAQGIMKEATVPKTIVLLTIALLLVGCASDPTQQGSPDELPFREQGDNSLWKATQKRAPYYPDKLVERGVEGCVNIYFVIDSGGKVERYLIGKSLPEGAFDDYALATLKGFRYEATDQNPDARPVLSHNVFTFALPGDNQADRHEELRSSCRPKKKPAIRE